MPHTLTPGDGQDLFARFKRAREKRDSDAMLELFSDGAEYRIDPFTEPLVGLNAIREHWNAVGAEQVNVDYDAERVWVSGHTVLGSWHAAFTISTTAERTRVRGFSAMELDESGRVTRMRDWPMRRAVGIDDSHKLQGTPEETRE